MVPSLSPRGYRVLAVVYAVLVATVSSWPSVRLPQVGVGAMDKLLHFGQYVILAYLVVRGWGRIERRLPGRSIFLLMAVLIAFSAFDEYHQVWIPGREPEWRDWLADLAGIMVGWSTGVWRLRSSSRNQTLPEPN